MRFFGIACVACLAVATSVFAQGASDGGRANSRFFAAPASAFLSRVKLPLGFHASSIVIHKLGGTLQSAVNWISRPHSEVSCHYLIGKDGQVVQMVKEGDVAYHVRGMNRESYCVGFEGTSEEVLTDAQIAAGREIVTGLERDKGIDHVVLHHDIVRDTDCAVGDDDLKAITTIESF